MAELIRSSDAQLRYLSEVITGYSDIKDATLIGSLPFEYKTDLHYKVKKILDLLESGEIVSMKPLNREILEIIATIKSKLEE